MDSSAWSRDAHRSRQCQTPHCSLWPLERVAPEMVPLESHGCGHVVVGSLSVLEITDLEKGLWSSGAKRAREAASRECLTPRRSSAQPGLTQRSGLVLCFSPTPSFGSSWSRAPQIGPGVTKDALCSVAKKTFGLHTAPIYFYTQGHASDFL